MGEGKEINAALKERMDDEVLNRKDFTDFVTYVSRRVTLLEGFFMRIEEDMDDGDFEHSLRCADISAIGDLLFEIRCRAEQIGNGGFF